MFSNDIAILSTDENPLLKPLVAREDKSITNIATVKFNRMIDRGYFPHKTNPRCFNLFYNSFKQRV